MTGYENGKIGEGYAKNFLEHIYDKVIFLDNIIDFECIKNDRYKDVIEYTYYEIKTCQKAVVEDNNLVSGRFKLHKDQDTYLKNVEGFYMFIILNNKKLMSLNIVKAKKLIFLTDTKSIKINTVLEVNK